MGNVIGKIKDFSFRYEPEILIGLGIGGFISTAVLSSKASVSIYKKNRKGLTKKEKIKIFLKAYWPTLLIGASSSACIISGALIKNKRYSALATAFAITEATAKTYQEKVIETIGERRNKTISDSIVGEKISNDKRPLDSSNIIVTSYGDMRCYDYMSDRYFTSDIQKIQKAVNDLNRRMRDEECISLNDFYDEIGLPLVTIGDVLGWKIDSGYIDLDYSSHLSPDGVPCLAINYSRFSKPISIL